MNESLAGIISNSKSYKHKVLVSLVLRSFTPKTGFIPGEVDSMCN